mgnify:CR=1 FL=1
MNPNQLEEWLREVEQRPSSAPLIIDYLSKRLRDLTSRNEELLAENIELRSGRKVEEYESRIANLEYQLDLLKRQFSGDISRLGPVAQVDTFTLLIYNAKGQVLRVEQPLHALVSGTTLNRINDVSAGGPVRLLVTNQYEELLCVFDSGRTIAVPVNEVPALSGEMPLTWSRAYLAEPRGGEELATILPIARMSLFDFCIQTSRRGCAKKMMKTSFESHVSKDFIGSGIKAKPDKTCDLVFTGKDDVLLLASREGFVIALSVNQLPYTIEEVFKIGPTDYIVTSAVLGKKRSLLIITQNGKVVHRDTGWIEQANSFKSRGQPVYSQSRREAGTRVAAAALVDAEDWAVSLVEDGQLRLHSAADIISAGTLFTDPAPDDSTSPILEFTTFEASNPSKAGS